MAKQKAEPVKEHKLTDKQQRFVEEYCKDCNATQAAIRSGYSHNMAYSIGWENTRKPEIRAAIDKRLNELALSAEETLKSISDIAKGNLNDYFTVKKVERKPRVRQHLSDAIIQIQNDIEDADKFIVRAKIQNEDILNKHNAQQENRRLQIIKHEIELERNPNAFIYVEGEPEIIEVAELDLPRLVRDKEAGRIKSVKHSEHGLNVEMYAADAALTNLARIHGLFEKDNKQVKPDNNVVIFKLPDNGRG